MKNYITLLSILPIFKKNVSQKNLINYNILGNYPVMKIKLDNYDHSILKILQTDASLSIEEIAVKVNLSRNPCWRRIKRMEDEGVISKRIVLLNPKKLNLDLSVIVLLRTNKHEPSWLSKFEKAVQEIPQILGAYRMAGDIDYMLRIQLSNVRDYDNFYQNLISKVSLSDISASFVMDTLKETTELPL